LSVGNRLNMFVEVVVSKQVCVSISMTLNYTYLCQDQLITLYVHHRFDDEVKDDDKSPDYPYSRSLSGSRTRSLVSCDQVLNVNTVGPSRDGFTLKEEEYTPSEIS